MTSFEDMIRIEYADLPIGASSRQEICPSCEGGITRERSMRIYRTAKGLQCVCFRATCPRPRVFVPANGSASTLGGSLPQIRKPRTGPYSKPSASLGIEDWSFLGQRFGVSPDDIHGEIRKALIGGRLLMECRDLDGRLFATQARKYPELGCRDDLPKVITYWEDIEDDHNLKFHFPYWSRQFIRGKDTSLFIVEDILSSIKLSTAHFVNRRFACAALGTHLTPAKMLELKRISGCTNIVIALDSDATDKANKYAYEFAPLFNSVKVLRLERDIKNMSFTSITTLLENAGL